VGADDYIDQKKTRRKCLILFDLLMAIDIRFSFYNSTICIYVCVCACVSF